MLHKRSSDLETNNHGNLIFSNACALTSSNVNKIIENKPRIMLGLK